MTENTGKASDIILKVDNASASFSVGGEIHRAVSNVTLEVKRGEILGVVGESGSGKTTLARMIVGIYTPDEGEIYYEGERIRAGVENKRAALREIDARGRVEFFKLIRSFFKLKAERERIIKEARDVNDSLQLERRKLLKYIKDVKRSIGRGRSAHPKIQMIFQDPTASLNPRMTIGEIVSEGLIIKGVYSREEIDKRVDEVLLSVGLSPECKSRYPSEFSGGQKQRIGIARAIIMEPELIIADEPVSALDVSIGAQVINLLFDLKERLGLSIIFIAHDLSVVRHVTDRVAVMYRGRLVELASTEELFDNALHPYTRSLLSAMPHPDPRRERRGGARTPRYEIEPKGELVEALPGHFLLEEVK